MGQIKKYTSRTTYNDARNIKKVAELTQGSLRAGMKITPNGQFLAPRAPEEAKNPQKIKIGPNKEIYL